MIDEEKYYGSILDTSVNDLYLKHHGVEGMKWGEQNGPPYPLSGEGKKNFIQQKKEVFAEKKRKRMLNDPKKVLENAHMFSKEEIDEANEKFESLKKTREHAKTVSLSRKQQRMAKDPMTLEKNMHKFKPEELELAVAQLEIQNKIWDKKLEEIKKPQKTLKVADEYLGTAVSIIKNILNGATSLSGLNDMKIKKSGHGLTLDDQYEVYKKKYHGDRDVFTKKVTDKQVKEFLNDLTADELDELLKNLSHSEDDDNYLMHFGILGQKWGKRNGPPYPLDKSDYSSAEKKANGVSDENKKAINKGGLIGGLIGGVPGAIIGGAIANKKYNSQQNISKSSSPNSNIKNTVDEKELPYKGSAKNVDKDCKITTSIETYKNKGSDEDFTKIMKNVDSDIRNMFKSLDTDKSFINMFNELGIKESHSSNEFTVHNIHIAGFDNDSIEYVFTMWPSNESLDRALGYHTVTVEYDPQTKKIDQIYMDG